MSLEPESNQEKYSCAYKCQSHKDQEILAVVPGSWAMAIVAPVRVKPNFSMTIPTGENSQTSLSLHI